jgi:hypothetical protein
MAQVVTKVTRYEAQEILEKRIWDMDSDDIVGDYVDILRYGGHARGWHQMANYELEEELNTTFANTTYEVID